MRLAIAGLGASGTHAARRAVGATSLVLHDTDAGRVDRLVAGGVLASPVERRTLEDGGYDVAVLATPVGTHADLARTALDAGAHVVSMTDDAGETAALLALDQEAVGAGRTVLVGAGFAPGLTCLLALHAAALLDEVIEIDVAKSGTGGPACARQHHRAMKDPSRNWFQGTWEERRGGSGRDLAWFPPPIGARDAYRASLPSPVLLQRRFPDAERISARVTATRRDRLTSRLPMLRPPHEDGGPGAVRVEVRGRRQGVFTTVVYASVAHPSMAAGSVAAICAAQLTEREGAGGFGPGSVGLSEIDDPLRLLRPLHDLGVRAATFEGGSP